MKANLNGCANVTLVQDGWSNIHNEPVIATCLLVDDKYYLLDSVLTGTISKTSDNYRAVSKFHESGQREIWLHCHEHGVRKCQKYRAKQHSLKAEDDTLIVYAWLWCTLAKLVTLSWSMSLKYTSTFRNHQKPYAWLTECTDNVKTQIPGEIRWKD